MDLMILSTENWQRLNQKLDTIQEQLSLVASAQQSDRIIDDKQFMKLLGISSKTAYNIRNAGAISFSRVRKKIYYNMKDVKKLMENKKEQAF